MVPEEAIGEAVAFAGRVAIELTAEFIFSKHGTRYFHGIGRRVIAVATIGKKRVPSSLRRVPKGTHPKPRRSDWVALYVGITTFLTASGGVVAAYVV